ncbi:peptidylprolyl isomerase [Marisediminicola sp. LYQ134]|uniref:peptidylprolyl isomerase n=1 Tax=Marisediminicola sp. LYQ134 TaxID=3391061 RepID=UPI003983D8E7
MAQGKSTDRAARERLRLYRARQTVHVHQVERRRRDNLLAIAAVVVVVTLATIGQVTYFTSGPGAPDAEASESASEDAAPDASGIETTGDVPSIEIAEGREWTGTLEINDVDLGIRLDGELAPQATSVFISLAREGYYDGNECHRLTSSESLKVLQCGQPSLDGPAAPDFSYGPPENAPDDGGYPAGTLAMARAESLTSQTTQFFVTYEDSVIDPSAGGYTVFGQVTSGLDEFVAAVASAGVEPADDGSARSDGPPVVPATIGSITVE